MTILRKRLQEMILSHNMTVSEVERKAGLRLNSVRNIVNGLSKKPSAETLQAIADIFNCSIKDLLDQKENDQNTKDQEYNASIEYPELFIACVSKFLEICQYQDYKPTLKKALSMICDLYFYSLEKGTLTPDEYFIKWLIKRNL